MKRYRDGAKDYAWFLNQPENVARYAGQIVLLHHHQILGSGMDYPQAAADAQQRAAAENRTLPPPDEILMLTVHEPYWFEPEYFSGPTSPQPKT